MKHVLKSLAVVLGAAAMIPSCRTQLGTWHVADLNEAGVMVGTNQGVFSSNAVVYSDGTLSVLPGPPPQPGVADGPYRSAVAIAHDGTVLGEQWPDTVLLWQSNGSFTTITSWQGWSARPIGINNAHTIIGTAHKDPGWRGWIHEGGKSSELRPPAAMADGYVTPTDINNRGEVVGYVTNYDGLTRAVLYAAGNRTGTWTSELGCKAHAINENGVIAGSCGIGAKPVYWPAAGQAPVELPLGGRVRGEVLDVNDEGVMVGFVAGGTDVRTAVKWTADGTLVPFTEPSQDGSAVALRINNQGTIVGQIYATGGGAVRFE